MRWRRMVAGFVCGISCTLNAEAQIYNWQNSSVIPGTENVVPGPGLQLSGAQLDYARLLGLNLTGSDFSAASLRSAQFNGSQLVGVNLSNANLGSAFLVGANLTDANIQGANLSSVTPGLAASQFYATRSYQDKKLSGIQLSYNDLSSWNFAGQDLSHSVFEQTTLHNASFAGADLSDAKFTVADLSGADFKGARFFQRYSAAVRYTFENSKLIGADLSGVDLSGISFQGTTLTNANLSDTIIADTTFMFGSPSFAQLSSTLSFRLKDLRGIRLWDGMDFRNADLSGFNLSNAKLNGSDFTGTDLTGAMIEGTSFLNATLTPQQLYSTQSYLTKNLRGVTFSQDLANFNLESQDLSNSTITSVNLNSANFTDAIITGVAFITPLTNEQLYSTKSYKNRDLRGVRFWSAADLKNADLSGQNLTGAWIPEGTSNIILTNAIIRDASVFRKVNSNQIYSTKSYQDKDLRGVIFSTQNLQNWDFTGQDLRGASFENSQLGQATFSQANVTEASFLNTNLTKEQLYATKSYQDHDLHGVRFPQFKEAWNLSGQDLRNAQVLDVKGSDLRGANLSSAYLLSYDLDTALVNSDTFYDQWTIFAGEFDPVAAGMTRVETAMGDFNANGQFDVDDLRGFERWLHFASSRRNDTVVASPFPWLPMRAFDLSGDQEVDQADLEIWVHDLKQTTFGDANLDGTFDSGDLVEVFAAGEYEDTYTGHSHWFTGDWNLDGDFNSTDLLLAFQDGGFESTAAARPGSLSIGQTAAVPEPGTWSLLTIIGPLFARRRSQQETPA